VRPDRIAEPALGQRSRTVAKCALPGHDQAVRTTDSRGIPRDFDVRVTAAPGLPERPLDAPEVPETHVRDHDQHAP
jgi:hypothetical protein